MKKTLFTRIILPLFFFTLLICASPVIWCQTIKVACVGDSITYGWGLSDRRTESPPGQLQELLGSGYTVNNYGVSGATLMKSGNKPYWEQSAFTNSTNWLPNIVIIMLGSNDSKSGNWANKADFVTDCLAMLSHYTGLSSQPVVYLATCPKVYGSGAFGITDPVVTGEIVPLQKQTAAQTGTPLIDVNAATTGMSQNFPDKVHPNAAGATVIAQAFYNAIQSLPPGYTNPPTDPPVPTTPPTPLPPGTQILEAEDAYYSDGAVETDHTGYSGSGYVNSTNTAGPYIEWSVTVSSAGPAQSAFRYANGADARPMQLTVNSSPVTTLDFPNTGAWTTWQSVPAEINLNSGTNTIRITSLDASGAPNIDKLDLIISSSPTPPPTVPPILCGDVNLDGIVNIVDALMTAQHCVGLYPPNFTPGNADVNGDGSVNIVDALMIAQYYVGLLESLSC